MSSSAFVKVDLYGTLGLTPKAGQEEITTAYRKKALRAHPDRSNSTLNLTNAQPANNKLEIDHTTFEEIKFAYEILREPKTKKLYDRYGAVALTFLYHTGGDVDTTAALLDSRKQVIILSCVLAVLSTVLATPLLSQMRLDRWLMTPWWLCLMPWMLLSGLAWILVLLAVIVLGLSISRPSEVPRSTEEGTESNTENDRKEAEEHLENLKLALLQITAFGMQLVILAVSLTVDWKWMAWWMVLLPWATYEAGFIIYRTVTVTSELPGNNSNKTAFIVNSFRWPTVRMAFLVFLCLHGQFFWWWTKAVLFGTVYLAILMAFWDAHVSLEQPMFAYFYLALHPLLSVIILHVSLTTDRLGRWSFFWALVPSYALLMVPLLFCVVAIPACLLWHRRVMEEPLAQRLLCAGHALGPIHRRIKHCTPPSTNHQ